MALSERELDIARQIKEQGGDKEDFLDILEQIRATKPKAGTEVKTAEVQEAPKQEFTSIEPKQDFLTPEAI